MPEYKRAKYIGRVFQDPMVGTAGNMQIEENLILAMRRGKSLGLKWAFKDSEQAFFKERLALLGLGLEDRLSARMAYYLVVNANPLHCLWLLCFVLIYYSWTNIQRHLILRRLKMYCN